MNYKLEKGPDGTVWVSIQPLQMDINKSLEHLVSIDTSTMTAQEQDIMEFNILGMKAIYTFLGALLEEQKQKEYRDAKTD